MTKGNYVSFNDARKFAQSLGLSSIPQWRAYSKGDSELPRKPSNIPARPDKVYAKCGWKGYPDFMGYEWSDPSKRVFIDIRHAKDIAKKLGIKTGKKWREFYEENNNDPLGIKGIPKFPNNAYAESGWNGWDDFTGTFFAGFEESREFARSLGLKTSREWIQAVSGEFSTIEVPENIPMHPYQVFNKTGEWNGWPDFLGFSFASYDEARSFAISSGVSSYREWNDRFTGENGSKFRPDNIPANPCDFYKKRGEWRGWQDFHGYRSMWNMNSLRVFVKSLIDENIISGMSQAELHVIAQQNGLFVERIERPEFIKGILSGVLSKSDLEDFADGIENDKVSDLYGGRLTAEQLESGSDDLFSDEVTETKPVRIDAMVIDETSEEKASSTMNEIENQNAMGELPTLSAKYVLDSLETSLVAAADEHAATFLVSQAVFKMWKRAYLSPQHLAEVTKETAKKRKGEYSERARVQFREEMSAAKKMKIPAGYAYRTPDGKKVKPNLMQRHIATRVVSARRFANWSGTGAGKTLSAILTSRLLDAELTVITCPSTIVDAWERELHNAFPDSRVAKDTFTPEWEEGSGPRYLVIGYGRFGTRTAASDMQKLMKSEKIDFVVVDELHKAKQRDKESNRRKMVQALCIHRPGLCVLGMTATPVVNNLKEAVSLIEIVTGEKHDEINTKATVNNCITVFQHLSQIGIRWMPDYQEANTTYPRIDASHRIEELRNCDDGSILQVERILTEEKVPEILNAIEDGTVIYTEFVGEGLTEMLRNAIEADGWTVGMYTGSDKTGLQQFKDGEVNVLIGSSSIGTGVNDLQYRSKKLIIACLPWTSADNKQLIGRLVRQGQENEVEIVIPVTYVEGTDHEGIAIDWSWCQSRVNRIRFKQSISDAAVDGTVPSGRPQTVKEALKHLHGWMERLSKPE